MTAAYDLAVRGALEMAGVADFIDENGGGSGVRLRNPQAKNIFSVIGYVSTLMRVQSAFERAESASSIAIVGAGSGCGLASSNRMRF
jgi:hypothetical protein